MQEEGDHRLLFNFNVTFAKSDDATRKDAALLCAAARMVRRLGSARRRGRGQCVIHVINESGQVDESAEEQLLADFKKYWLEENPVQADELQPAWAPATGTGGARRIRVIIRTNEPMLIARRSEAGNMFDGVDYINGSTLWGALASAAAEKWRFSGRADGNADAAFRDNQAYQAFRRLFLHGEVRISPCYPVNKELANLVPMIPAPRDFLTCKVYKDLLPQYADLPDQHHVAGYAAGRNSFECLLCKNDVPLVPVEGYLPVKTLPQGEKDFTPQRRDELHPRVNPYTQRVSTGDLFGYVALESGQYFMGEIWCQNENAWLALQTLTGIPNAKTTFSLRLGKATRRGYGLANVWLEEYPVVDQWRGLPMNSRIKMPDDGSPLTFTLTLLSDAILPDHWGRFHQSLDDADWIEELLDDKKFFQLERDAITNLPKIIHAFCKAGYADNFNNQLGLPRWRDLAIKAGSAVGFKIVPPAFQNDEEREQWRNKLQSRLEVIESEGISRRNEGFGMVVFNHPLYDLVEITGTEWKIEDEMKLVDPQAKRKPKAMPSIQITMKSVIGCENCADKDLEKLIRAECTNEFEIQKWQAVARWLWSSAGQPISVLRSELEQFGKPDLLTNVTREPKEHFSKQQTQDAIAHLKERLKAIEEKGHPPALRTKLVQMLANRLAIVWSKRRNNHEISQHSWEISRAHCRARRHRQKPRGD
jgi:CRISPR-associated protein Csx10